MKRVLCLLLAALSMLLILVTFSGCAPDPGDMMFAEDGRFKVVECCGEGSYAEYILEDVETGVLYVFVKDGYNGGLTPLLDSKGEIQFVKRYK